MASTRGIFETEEYDGVLYATWSARKAELDTLRLQPYADLLLDNVVWPAVLEKKDEIFEQLKEKCRTATHPTELFVPIWSYNHVFDYPHNAHWPQGPPHAFALERGDPQAKKVEQIHNQGWRQYVSVEDADDGGWILRPEPVYKVITKTDFLQELALRFGHEFRISQVQEAINVELPTGESYYRIKITLMLNSYPYGLPEHFAKARDAHIAAPKRVRRLLSEREETMIFWRGNPLADLVPPPPVPRTNTVFVPCPAARACLEAFSAASEEDGAAGKHITRPPPLRRPLPKAKDPYKTMCPYFETISPCPCHYHNESDSDDE